MFLATTALSEFWDKDQEILFLGSWCLRYDRRNEWKGLRYQVMPSPWDDRKRFYDATTYLDEFGERILNNLTDYLNAVHQVSHSQRYWRMLVGPWLLHYLHAAYDRYVHLVEAFRRHPQLQTIVLDPQAFRASMDTMDLVGFVSNDPYNLQIFSQLLQGMGYSFPKRIWGESGNGTIPGSWRCASDASPPSVVKPEIDNVMTRWEWCGALKDGARSSLSLSWEIIRRVLGNRWHVAICDISAPRGTVYTLAWQTGFRALPIEVRGKFSFTPGGPVFDRRRNDLGTLPASTGFERVFVLSLPQNFPTLYLEAYQNAKTEVLRTYPRLPPVIVSASGWYFNEQFKYLSSEAVERGSRLVMVQHGGGYGIFRFSAPELHEARLGDRFMVWGWADIAAKSFRNLPSPKLSTLLNGQSRKTCSHKAETILFVATDHPLYLYRFHSTPVGSQWEDYFAWQLRFLVVVPDRLRSMIIYRNYRHEYGHAIRDRISERFSEVQWDDSRPMHKRLRHNRMVVIDNCGTTFLEALTSNVPTILFWDPERWEVREAAEPYFESLRKVGILWNSPEAAAKKVAEIYEDPQEWWESEAVQTARRRFVERFAYAREDWVKLWTKALRSEADVAGSAVEPTGARAEA